jgi:hypothetical protein
METNTNFLLLLHLKKDTSIFLSIVSNFIYRDLPVSAYDSPP